MDMRNITKMKCIHTPFQGHRVFTFSIKNDNEWDKSYYKLNKSLSEEGEYENIVDETIAEIGTLNNRTHKVGNFHDDNGNKVDMI